MPAQTLLTSVDEIIAILTANVTSNKKLRILQALIQPEDFKKLLEPKSIKNLGDILSCLKSEERWELMTWAAQKWDDIITSSADLLEIYNYLPPKYWSRLLNDDTQKIKIFLRNQYIYNFVLESCTDEACKEKLTAVKDLPEITDIDEFIATYKMFCGSIYARNFNFPKLLEKFKNDHAAKMEIFIKDLNTLKHVLTYESSARVWIAHQCKGFAASLISSFDDLLWYCNQYHLETLIHYNPNWSSFITNFDQLADLIFRFNSCGEKILDTCKSKCDVLIPDARSYNSLMQHEHLRFKIREVMIPVLNTRIKNVNDLKVYMILDPQPAFLLMHMHEKIREVIKTPEDFKEVYCVSMHCKYTLLTALNDSLKMLVPDPQSLKQICLGSKYHIREAQPKKTGFFSKLFGASQNTPAPIVSKKM